jgi:5-amino-6-(5-phospho-D-ribitylamino)uracil phosphatase
VLFAFDLDRTVLTDDYRLPTPIAAAIAELRRAGHQVTVLTGRPMPSARRFIEALGIDGPFSVNHGAQVMDVSGRALRRIRLRSADVRLLLDPWRSHPQVEFSCVIDDTLLVKNPDDIRWRWAHTESRSVTRFDPTLPPEADKVVFASSETSVLVAEHVERSLPHVERYLWGDNFLEIIGPGADKGSALAFIAERLGVAREAVVAFGDGLNDVSMLSWAGHGVAVGPHAHPDTIAVADERIASPEEGGVNDWVDRFLR